MLVLSRKVGERIHVGENVTIEVRRVAGNRVTLALDAPRNVRILRGELEPAVRAFQPASPRGSIPARRTLKEPPLQVIDSLPAESGSVQAV